MFAEALASGHMEVFFALASEFHTQAEPAFCGLGTLTMVLNALQIDPGRQWKGVWRYYSEDLLSCCKSLDEVKREGLTFDEVVCLARCNALLVVEEERGDDDAFGVDSFRAAVEGVVTQAENAALVVSYDRSVLGQTGAGHFSAIGGFHPESDSVLIMDVARFKYPPHWVSLPLLVSAMQDSLDPVTQRPRGWVWLAPDPGATPLSSLFALRESPALARSTLQTLGMAITAALEDQPCQSGPCVSHALIDRIPLLLHNVPFVTQHADDLKYVQRIASAVELHPLYETIPAPSKQEPDVEWTLGPLTPSHLFVLIVLALPPSCVDHEISSSFSYSLPDSLLEKEVAALQRILSPICTPSSVVQSDSQCCSTCE